MIRLMIRHYNIEQMCVLRNCLSSAYVEAVKTYPFLYSQTVTKDIANTLSWLEDEITKREAE